MSIVHKKRQFWSEKQIFNSSVWTFCSSILGEDNYLGYYLDWSSEFFATAFHITVLVTSASFHLGMCMHIEGMVADLRGRMAEINDELNENQRDNPAIVTRVCSKLTKQIDFHVDILS